MRRTTTTLVGCVLCLAPSLGARQNPPAPPAVTVEAILAQAGRYVARFVEEFSNVVAEETYVQDVVLPRSGPASSSGRLFSTTHRELRSDFLLLKVGGPLEWRPYRDVFEVDGKAVRDREERLMKLFVQPSSTAHEQAARIAQESARYNIGLTRRTLNTPVLALLFLQAHIQPRFRFTLGRLDRSVGESTWTVQYREQVQPTLIRALVGDSDQDLLSAGRFWIDSETGRVARTELVVSAQRMMATITTSFAGDTRLVAAAPRRMSEQYTVGGSRITGVATYSHFRRFEVTTKMETVAPGR